MEGIAKPQVEANSIPLSSQVKRPLAKAAPFFKESELARLDKQNIPRHVAVIPDGNRRWAKANLLQVMMGHQRGADTIIDIVLAAKEIGIRAITFYTFSTENWSRSAYEVSTLMNILEDMLITQTSKMVANDIRVDSIGDLSRMPEHVLTALADAKNATQDKKGIDFILALNYGGRDELRRVVCKIMQDHAKGLIEPEELTEEKISTYMDTASWPDPELIIRTSGEVRISNFLLWQSSYSEWVISDLLWPEFKPKHLLEVVLSYQQRERRMGGALKS